MPPLRIDAVWTAEHRRHAPETCLFLGVPIPTDELPDRGDALRDGLVADPAVTLHAPDQLDLAPILAVHDAAYVDFLSRAMRDWRAAGHHVDPGSDVVIPYSFPNPGFRPGRQLRHPGTIRAEVGVYGADTCTVIADGTWEAAVAAAHAAVTAARLCRDGAARTYAAVRPPGHHAAPAVYGGACYLNNAAIAAHWLTENGVERVAIVDVDAHHGNGTQEIFYTRGDVFYGSLHGDPAFGYPHWLGFADERGDDEGVGTNHNEPLAPGADDDVWLAALARIVESLAAFRPEVLVVSLGVDALAEDENSATLVSVDGYARAGDMLGGLGLPTVSVQEGGYVVPLLPKAVLGFLHGLG